MPNDFVIDRDDLVKITVHYADNQLVVLLNEHDLYHRKTERQPRLNDEVPLNSFLVRGVNYLNILGIDWGGAARYAFVITKNGEPIVGPMDDRFPGQHGLVTQYNYRLIVTG